jgi:Sec-independent protein secretion pathway component TatC
MYATMALLRFGVAHREMPPTSPVFWWAMQAAMFGGFVVAWPVTAVLVKRGIKPRM